MALIQRRSADFRSAHRGAIGVSMENSSNRGAFAMLTKILCIGFVGILLAAGLAPFHSPKNQVKWLEKRNGLQFSRYSSILSAAAFHATAANDTTSESIELWLAPTSLRSTNTILSFDESDHPGAAFLLRQYKDALVVRQPYIDNFGTSRIEWLAAMKAVREASPTLLTITLGKQGTSIYLDGVVGEAFEARGTSTNNLTGRLVLANSPQANDSWAGQILGLAIYHSQLTATQVAEHYRSWKRNRQPSIGKDEAPVALYLFNEGNGNIVHNQLDSTTGLIIPEHYFVLHPQFLSSVMSDYRANWHYWQDIAVNIVGFIPLGFLVATYFSEVRTIKHPAATTIVVGLLISFTIESLQFFLPTRSCGSTDLITNTLGTAIGLMFYRSWIAQSLLAKARQLSMSMKTKPAFRHRMHRA
jgi:glycopeptide antibiotics resistance protein